MSSTHILTTIGDLVTAQPALDRLAALPLPTKAAYTVAKLCRLVTQETKDFYKVREDTIRELGEEVGDQIRVKPDNLKEYIRRVEELSTFEVTLDWSPLNASALGDSPVTAADIMALGPLLTDDLQ